MQSTPATVVNEAIRLSRLANFSNTLYDSQRDTVKRGQVSITEKYLLYFGKSFETGMQNLTKFYNKK